LEAPQNWCFYWKTKCLPSGPPIYYVKGGGGTKNMRLKCDGIGNNLWKALGTSRILWAPYGNTLVLNKRISKIHEVSHLIHNIDVWRGVRKSVLDDETYESLLKLGPKWI
jgi:hypothetical protein